MATDQNKSYDSSAIRVLRGLDAVRTRPGMYIGNTDDGSGLHHMVFEVVDNSIDEALAGYCSHIKVTIHEDNSVSVADDGRGIPTEIHPEEGVSAAEVVMTVLHAGGKFDAKTIAGGLHGVGVSVVNALSSKLFLQIRRDGKIHEQTYLNGVPQEPLKVVGETNKTGTTVRFWPSYATFKNVTEFSYDILCNRLRELSFLNSNVKITLSDERDGRKDEFHYVGGLQAFVKFLNKNKAVINEEPFYFSSFNEELGITVEVAMQWNDTYKENILCFTNNIPQRDGGTHLIGFKAALTRTLNGYIEREVLANAKTKALKELKVDGDDSREGLVAIVSVKVPNPKFSSQTKDKLVSSEVRGVVESAVNDQLQTTLEENPKIAKIIVDKVISAARTREAARRARELARTNKKHSFTTNKLVHCNSRNPEECEVYLVEGDSAGGSAVKARDVQTQAILPLRGKILNVEKARFDKIIESQEIANIIAVLKCGINDEFNIDNLRYHKIVIMTDADVDGSHIRTLLLTFFFRQMPQLIEAGKVYIAQPPLFKLTVNRKPVYFKNKDEYDRFLIDYSLEGATLLVDDKAYASEDLKELCERYLLLNAKFESHTRKYSPEVMRTLLNYHALTLDTLKDKEQLTSWTNGLIDLLRKTQDQSVRYLATYDHDDESNLYSVKLQEIKHGMSTDYEINKTFVESNDYQQVVSLANEIANILPIDNEQSKRFVVHGSSKTPIRYFNEFIERLATDSVKKLNPSRYKGLGEMNWEELEETTMKVDNRTLLKVEVKDAILADQLFTTLMGDDVSPRRDFIEENALYANVDL
ncbi:DNA gyrase subunit B [Psittacicella melopsittaci]|uniref:DNA gyrase subunit B n=1 Tax=Psittacicella melopsittaci TaxID=2028576 RepID=A0A3A1Y3M9_9GAMM|nr:DNA gyrase subunit B [Psittacicella melopsittaci]RIY31856.1 DNA gyrase subunit B [Psittacicella melopsittaci]